MCDKQYSSQTEIAVTTSDKNVRNTVTSLIQSCRLKGKGSFVDDVTLTLNFAPYVQGIMAGLRRAGYGVSKATFAAEITFTISWTQQ